MAAVKYRDPRGSLYPVSCRHHHTTVLNFRQAAKIFGQQVVLEMHDGFKRSLPELPPELCRCRSCIDFLAAKQHRRGSHLRLAS